MEQLRRPGRRWVTSRSPIRTLPLVTDSSPAIMRSVVVLPQPDGPTSTTNSLSAISRSSGGMTVTAPKDLVTFCRVTRAMDARLSAIGNMGALRPGGTGRRAVAYAGLEGGQAHRRAIGR